jgi:hypothetical protein
VDPAAICAAVRLFIGVIQNRLVPEILRETARLAEEDLRGTTAWDDGHRPLPPETLSEHNTLILHGERLMQLLAGLDDPEAVQAFPLDYRESLARVRRLLPEYVRTRRAEARGDLLRAFEAVLGGFCRQEYVTLNQMAAMVNRSQRTLERLKTNGTLPPPDVEGGGGAQDEWLWDTVRPILSARFRRPLPEHFPAARVR